MIRRTLPFLLLAVALPAQAAKLSVDEDTFVDVRFFLQTWAQAEQGAAPDGDSYGKDLFLRRARIWLGGQLNDRIGYVFDTDAVNYGKDNYDADIFIQDAFAIFKLEPTYLILDVGFMYVPLTHHIDQGAFTLFSLDFHPTLFRFPAFSNRVNRDVGVQLRGIAAETLQYRLGVYRGVRGSPADSTAANAGLNPKDDLRYNGQLRFNVFEPEVVPYFAGIYFNEKRVLSFGFGADYQMDAVRDLDGDLADYTAFGGDVFLDLPLAERQELIAQSNVIYWNNGDGSPNTGLAWFVELGYRYGVFSPVVSYERFTPDESGFDDSDAWRFTGIWWIDQHAANLKLEVATTLLPLGSAPAPVEDQDRRMVTTLQAQIFF